MSFLHSLVVYASTKYFWQQIGIAVAVVAIIIAIGFIPFGHPVINPIPQSAPVPSSIGTWLLPFGHSQSTHEIPLNTAWTLITTLIAFIAIAGFGCFEAGLSRSKNCVSALAKSIVVFAMASVAFWVCGFGLMFGGGSEYVGRHGVWLARGEMIDEATGNLVVDNSPSSVGYVGPYQSISWARVPLPAKVFHHLILACIACAIAAAAVAERSKFVAVVLFGCIFASVVYPVVGHWIWGGGIMALHGFKDFAGSTVIYSVGGWAALAGAIMTGPRIGKYGPDGKVFGIPPHNMLATFIGWFFVVIGCFGLNLGASMGVSDNLLAIVAMNSVLAAAAATVSATFTTWIILGKPDLVMTLSGSLSGLVAIAASCPWVVTVDAAIIGAVAGTLSIAAIMFFDRVKVDDPVGATGIFLVNGILGTLSVGLFSSSDLANGPGRGFFYGGGIEQLEKQLIGSAFVGASVFIASAFAWAFIKSFCGVRVHREEEIEGLDLGEHGNHAYSAVSGIEAGPY